MSIASEITRLQGAKANIKTAIEAKGVEIPSNATLDEYSDYVEEIPSGGTDTRWQEIGYEEEPEEIQDGIDYAKEIMQNWDASVTDRSDAFKANYQLKYFPNVDTSNITNAKNMFYNARSLEKINDNFDFSSMTNCESMFQNCPPLKLNNVIPATSCNMHYMFNSVSSLEINYLRIQGNSNNSYICSSSQKIIINTLSINFYSNSVQHAFNNIPNLKINKIENTINLKSLTKNILTNCVMDNATIKEFLNFFSTLTSQSSSYKTLQKMGFTQANCDIATTLPEWTALANAGWTTGY